MNIIDFLRGKRPALGLDAYVDKLKSRGLAPDGRQVPDPTPMAPPIGYKKQPSMVEIQRQLIRDTLSQYARENDQETFEEAEDFDVGDDPELMRSPFENDFDPPLEELLSAGRAALAGKQNAGGAGEPPREQPKPPEAAPTAPQEPSAKPT